MGRPPHDRTGPAAPPSGPGRHHAARAPARRAEITPPFSGRGSGALRAGAGYLAGWLARAARGEHIAFAIGARRIAPPGRLPVGAAQDDWREATGLDAA